jgi:Transposase DDE domain
MNASDRMDAALQVSPLSVLVRGVLEWAFPPGSWDSLFAQNAPTQGTRQLTISALTGLMIQVVSGARRSIHAAFQFDQAAPTPAITASVQAVYTKLGRLDPHFSEAAVRASAQRLEPVLRAAGCTEFPGWHGSRVRIIDGTDLAGSEHRLKVLRTIQAAGLPGRLVAEFDPATGLVVDVTASEDAYASERTLVQSIYARAQPTDLFVADRFYCTIRLLRAILDRRARFVIRQHQQLRWHAVHAARRLGRVVTGAVWEQPVVVEDPKTGRRQRFRRLILKLDTPTREGETEICLLTNLRSRVCGLRIVELYRDRWTIERQFSVLKTCLHGEVVSLGQPRAALFAMCLAMVAGNALAVVKQAVRAAHGEEEFAKLSGFYLADELAGNLRAIEALLERSSWEGLLLGTAAQFWAWAVSIAARIRTRALYRHPRGPKNPQVKRQSGKDRHHYSTYRLLNGVK